MMVVLVMIIVGVAILGIAIAIAWLVLVRGSKVTTITKEDFDHEYDELGTDGELVDRDRDDAWRDFHAWQLMNEKERLSWEETTDE
jgi:hypothetical protein